MASRPHPGHGAALALRLFPSLTLSPYAARPIDSARLVAALGELAATRVCNASPSFFAIGRKRSFNCFRRSRCAQVVLTAAAIQWYASNGRVLGRSSHTPTAGSVRESGERSPRLACSRRAPSLRAPTGTASPPDPLSPTARAEAGWLAGRAVKRIECVQLASTASTASIASTASTASIASTAWTSTSTVNPVRWVYRYAAQPACRAEFANDRSVNGIVAGRRLGYTESRRGNYCCCRE